jgi:hypothetical protein
MRLEGVRDPGFLDVAQPQLGNQSGVGPPRRGDGRYPLNDTASVLHRGLSDDFLKD